MLVHAEFNLLEEAMRLNIYEKYFDSASKLGIKLETFYKAVDILLKDNPNLPSDKRYLKPDDFKYFCKLLSIPFIKLCDDYYRFVLIKNYAKIIRDARLSMNLNQKKFGYLCRLSPVSIGKFENGLKYPSRRQYDLLKEVMNMYI